MSKFLNTLNGELFQFTVNNTRVYVRVWGLVLAAFVLGVIL